ncbi:MAG: flavodoxin family protein [Oscillospiraceae bacterium]|jgi:multimeric flavodoxin WrbA|nr:flavodoxin family protein [Oscillospiraceae bacterium]
MKILMLSGNPKSEGLCSSLETALTGGAQAGGAQVEKAALLRYKRCQVCADGWGSCREKHKCILDDGLSELQEKIRCSDAFILVTPVYWAEVAEGMKCALDRLRRCEFGKGAFAGKPAILAASPGGTGNGLLAALEQMERFCKHTGAAVFDLIGQNRWTAEYKRRAAFEAARAMASGVEPWKP